MFNTKEHQTMFNLFNLLITALFLLAVLILPACGKDSDLSPEAVAKRVQQTKDCPINSICKTKGN